MPVYSYNYIVRTASFLAAVSLLVLRNVYQYRDLRIISESIGTIDTLHSVGLTTRSVLEEDDHTIRSWGCNITASPFIFVHIGKNHIRSLLSKRRAVGCLSFFTCKRTIYD